MGTPASRAWGPSLALLLLLVAAGCGDGDGFAEPSNSPFPVRIEGVVTFSGGAGDGVVVLRSAADAPVSGAAVHLLDGRDAWRMTEYPPGSGAYRVAADLLPHRARYAVEVELDGSGRFRSEALSAPERHEIVSPEAFATYSAASGLEVAWTGGGTADAARISLSRNDRSDVEADDGHHRFDRDELDESTYDERVEVTRWREAALFDTLPGSFLRVEARESVTPFAVLP